MISYNYAQLMIIMKRLILLAVLFAIPVCLLTVVVRERNKPQITRAHLLNAIGHHRTFEARITGDVYYSPKVANLPPSRVRELVSLNREVIRFIEDGQRDQSLLAEAALLKALLGDLDGAITLMEEVVGGAPASTQLLNDLSVIYYERANRSGNPVDLLLAFHAANSAVQQGSRFSEAVYNRALILDRLSLSTPAGKGWRQYLALDSYSEWANEARRHLVRIELLKLESAKESAEVLAPLSWTEDVVVLSAARINHRQARLLIEEHLLFEWARAYRGEDKSSADFYIMRAATIAKEVREAFGDRFLESVVFHSMKAGGHAARDLVKGYLLYERGLQFYRAADYSLALSCFEKARSLLSRAGSPFALRAEFMKGCALHFNADYGQAIAVQAKLFEKCRVHKFKALSAEIQWMMGLSRFVLRQPLEAIAAYESAADIFIQLGELDGAGGARNLIAETLNFLGAKEAAWRHCYYALATVQGTKDYRRRYQIYAVAAIVAWRLMQPELALLIQEEALANSVKMNNPTAEAAALFWRARYLSSMRQPEKAALELAKARVIARSISEGPAQERALGDILLAESEILLTSSPRDAIPKLTVAIRNYSESGARYNLVTALRMRARAYRAIGDLVEAIQNLEEGIRNIEEWRNNTQDPHYRVTYLDTERAVFEEMIEIQLSAGNVREGFIYADRLRSRVLLDRISQGAGLEFREILSELPDNTALIEFAFVHGKLLVWLVDSSGIRYFREVRKVALVRSAAMEFWAKAANGKLQEKRFQEIGTILYGTLLESLPLGAYSRLVFSGEGFLNMAPFSALRNPANKKLLLETHALSITPSARIYVENRKRWRSLTDSPPTRVLVVGVPTPRGGGRVVPALRAVEDEIRNVAAEYPDALVLEGPTLTKSNLIREAHGVDVLHFAGHAIHNSGSPSLSYLYLPGVNAKGKEEQRLSGSEIGNLNLGKVRLVVLSACSTMDAVSSQTEGMQGLATSFLAAGVPGVVGAIGPVEDLVSSQLSVNFHMQFKTGLSPAEALRLAQLQMARESKPLAGGTFGWAAFQVME